MHISKNKIFFLGAAKNTFLFLLAAVFLASTIISSLPPPIVSAEGETYLLYYPPYDDGIKTSLKKLYDNGEQIDNPTRQYVSILASGGTFFGNDPQRMVYDIDVNNQMSNHGTGDDDDSDEQFFSRVYYCEQSSGDRSYTRPSGTNAYYRITYVIGMKVSDGNEFFNTKIHNDVWVGATKIQLVTPATAGTKGKPGQEVKVETIKSLNENDGPGELDNDIDKITNAKCRPKPVGGPGKIQVKNYYEGASEAEQARVATLIEAANSGRSGSGGADGSGGDDQPNCENTGSVLGFFMCPVIEGVSGASDWIFDTFIKGFLTNIPVSTDSADAGFKAWQAFRIMGNVVLIGALLAVVYYQARGGGN